LRQELQEVWELGPEDVLTHTHSGSPLACAAAFVVLDALPKLLENVLAMGERFESAGWRGAGLLRARPGDWEEAWRRGVIVVPAGPGGSLISATPPLTISEAEVDEALERLA
jgi:4-aminobutyrate aminotransferase-like enzyme